MIGFPIVFYLPIEKGCHGQLSPQLSSRGAQRRGDLTDNRVVVERPYRHHADGSAENPILP